MELEKYYEIDDKKDGSKLVIEVTTKSIMNAIKEVEDMLKVA